jgi:MFS transporter, FHS family, L-fucose permease
MFLGYLLGIRLIPKYLSPTRTLKICAGLGLAFALAALSTHGLGRFTPIGSSFLIVAIGGGALLPLLYGWLAALSSPQRAYWLVIPCYACIGWYALKGHKADLG